MNASYNSLSKYETKFQKALDYKKGLDYNVHSLVSIKKTKRHTNCIATMSHCYY